MKLRKKKIIIELSERCLKILKDKSKKAGRSRKNYIELVVLVHAVQVDVISVPPVSLSETKGF